MMAKLLDELTTPMDMIVRCPCGGEMYLRLYNRDYKCNECEFTLSELSTMISSSRNFTRILTVKYRQFKQKQNDPMNQLPSYYKKN